jgi:hypothetical protein
VLASSFSLLIRGTFAAVRQKSHLSACPNFPNHLLPLDIRVWRHLDDDLNDHMGATGKLGLVQDCAG